MLLAGLEHAALEGDVGATVFAFEGLRQWRE
jgi:hypothetical protein